MRVHGCIEKGSGLGTDGHACWAFDERQDFVDASLEYLADGLRGGQRLAYVSGEPAAEQRERLEALGDVGGMIDAGRLQLLALGDLYEVGSPVDTAAQSAVYLGFACEPGEPVSLNLEALEFIDHHGIEVLAAHAERWRDDGYEIRNKPAGLERLCELLDLSL